MNLYQSTSERNTAMTAFANPAPRAPETLITYRQFVVWKLELLAGNPKPSKVPYDPKTRKHASTSDATTWGSYDDAMAAVTTGQYSGIGFVISATDPFVFLDYDDCKTDDSSWIDGTSQWELFPDSAWEYSQSGNGIHSIVTVEDKTFLANHKNKWLRPDGGMNECYSAGRFIAFGSTGWVGEPKPADAMLVCFVPLRTTQAIEPLEWQNQPQDGYGGPDDDDKLIERLLASRGGPGSMFGSAPLPKALWEADGSVLGGFTRMRAGKAVCSTTVAPLWP